MHLLWPHRRGRLLTGPFADLPAASEMLEAVRSALRVARERGVTIDNVEELRLRFDGRPGVKNDLAGAGWTSLCLYTDGAVYPSASMTGARILPPNFGAVRMPRASPSQTDWVARRHLPGLSGERCEPGNGCC